MRASAALILLLFAASAASHAQQLPPAAAPAVPENRDATADVFTLREAAQRAVLHNSEVLARWHTIRAAEAERDAARGGLLPRVDLSAALGPERRNGVDETSRGSANLTISQLLYDGNAIRNEVRRLDHSARVRLFEFFETSENIALEATRAYLDVLRFRELSRLAENNFVEHRAVFTQIQRRVNARVARAVDLEQIAGRLALAEANLLTEQANLHDTSARFQRLIGRLPPRELAVPPHLSGGIPADAVNAIALAQSNNPALLAAVENVRASRAALETREGAYVPRFDARLRREQGRNTTGVDTSNNATAAEIVMSWNLFNGFADRARERQFAEQLNVARDLRDKTCRDIRQTLIIAYNDIRKLTEQLDYLVAHETAVGKALVAYRQQFDIGQRTLLDLLDTENELFQARRAVVNARHDLHLAYARTHAALGNLLRALELATLKSGTQAELGQWSLGADGAADCPAEPVLVAVADKGELVQRASQHAMRMGTLNARERAIVEVNTPGAVPSIAPGAQPSATAASRDPSPAAPGEAAVRAALDAWRTAWVERRIDDYLAFYSPAFVPPGGLGRAAWEARRRQIIGRAADVSIELEDVQTVVTGPVSASSSFVQHYVSSSYQDTVRKTLEWERVGERWLIRTEATTPLQ